MITKELLERAVKEAGEGCDKECAFSTAAEEASDLLQKDMRHIAAEGLAAGYDPMSTVYFNAIHVGYRLRQLEELQPADPSKLN